MVRNSFINFSKREMVRIILFLIKEARFSAVPEIFSIEWLFVLRFIYAGTVLKLTILLLS